MAEEYSFFNSVGGDRKYNADAFATFFKTVLSTGVFHRNNIPSLKVLNVSGLQTKVEVGSAYLEGYMYRNTEDKVLTHEQADITNPRIDRIVVRLDRSVAARNIKAVVKKGTAAINPQPPELQRDDIIYEISLAQVRINTGSTTITSIKDERLDEEVSGLVSSLISIPVDEFERRWNQWFSSIQIQTPAMGGMLISVGSAEPSSPNINDIWIDTNG